MVLFLMKREKRYMGYAACGETVFPKVDTPYGQAPLGLEGSKV